ncbi:cytochrome b [Propionivibrio limicola]|uniref:cytochrome b n=1 Tax=Propionivibrio limicola TaxID=167645 RepID=UPI0014792502|nr:cytochrome b/b6 domain-containing protein [Propionivibrio limicola]
MTPNRYHPALRVLHWMIAVLIVAALILGTFVMAKTPNIDPSKKFMLVKHMLTGFAILGLTLARIFVRPKTRRPPPVYSGIEMADWIVPFVHRIFDVLVLGMIASGVAIAIHVDLLGILWRGEALPEGFAGVTAHTIHVYVARALGGFLALHVCGAFYHQFVLRDRLLSRMSPMVWKNQNG